MDTIIKQGTRVYLRTPKREEISFIKSLWESEETMKAVGGVRQYTDEEYQSWFTANVDPGNSTDRFLIIFENENDIPIGEIGFLRFSQETKSAELSVTVKAKFRRRGFGRESLMLLCDFFFIDFGGEIMECRTANDNIAGQKMVENFGFEVKDETDTEVIYQLKKTDYLPE